MTMIDQPWQQYICRACGLIYDEAEGDPDSGLAAGTRFEDIPDDWECPLCGVTKTDFELFEKTEILAPPKTVSYSKQPGIVIVGAGIAGWSVIEAIRKEDSDIPITLVSACNGDRYHKPELSVAISRNMDVKKLIQENAEQAATVYRIKLLTNSYAVGIETHTCQLRTTRGTLNYTKLILAQGSKTFLPSQLPAEECWRINHISSWGGLQERLSKNSQRVAIVGAGMIGCELAEDLNKAGHHVTLINRDPYPLATLLPEKAADFLTEAMANLGISHIANAEINQLVKSKDGSRKLELRDKGAIAYDHLIVATGLITDSYLAKQANLKFNRGIVVDEKKLQTSNENIYALGDCISLNGVPCRFIEPIQHQARAIANDILELNQDNYNHAAPVIRLKTRCLPIVIRGLPDAEGTWHTVSADRYSLIMEQQKDHETVASLSLDLSKLDKAA